MAGTMRYRAGAWRLQVRAGRDPITGKPRFVTGTVRAPDTKTGRRKAEIELARLVTEVDARRITPRSDLTVAELLDRYRVARGPAWSAAQRKEAAGVCRRNLVPYIGDIAVVQLRGYHLDAMYAQLLDRGLAPGTVQKAHSTITAALSQAVKWEIIAANPAHAATPPAVPKTEPETPDPKKIARLLRAVDETDPAMGAWLRIAAVTGARRGQVCALQWRDLDLDAGIIRYVRALSQGDGELEVKSTKTGRTYTVAIAPGTVAVLERWRWQVVEHHVACGSMPGPESWVFEREPGGEPWRPDSTSRKWRQLRDAHGLAGVKLHALRHFMATELFAGGHDGVTVAGRGGWSNPSTPIDIYARFLPPRDQEAAAFMDRLVDGPAKES